MFLVPLAAGAVISTNVCVYIQFDIQALAARLEALEEDRIQPDAVAAASDDEEFVYADSDEGARLALGMGVVW